MKPLKIGKEISAKKKRQKRKKYKKQQKENEASLKDVVKSLKADKEYLLITENRAYKAVFISQKKDSITYRKPGKKALKKKDQMQMSKENLVRIKEKKFSQLRTDLLTASIYASAGAVALILLTQD